MSLIEWMRDYNRSHPSRTVHFMGNDLGAPTLSDDFFGRVTGYVQRSHPAALPQLNELYAGLRPIDDVFAYLGKPLAERQQLAAKAEQALALVSKLGARATRPSCGLSRTPGRSPRPPSFSRLTSPTPNRWLTRSASAMR